MKNNKRILKILSAIFTALTVISPVYAEGEETKENTTLTIHYEVETIESEDGTLITPGSVDPSEVTINVTDTEGVIEAPTVTAKEGYTFTGWKQDNESISSLPTNVSQLSEDIISAGSVTYTAVFSTTTSKAVEAFLNAVEELDIPEEITGENKATVKANLDSIINLYNALTDEEKQLTEVIGTYEYVQSIQAMLDGNNSNTESTTQETIGEKYYSDPVDGIKYLMTIGENNTCAIFAFEIADGADSNGPTELNIPETVTINGNSYTVTDISMVSTNLKPKLTNVKKITFPSTIAKMTLANFSQFSEIEEITIPSTVKTFSGTFQNTKKLKVLTFEEGVEEILGQGSFVSGLSNLKTVNFPNSLKTLNVDFRNATGLETVSFPDGLDLSDVSSLFYGCTSLKEVTLPAATSKIPASAFIDCTSLKTLKANGTITEIGQYAFQNCTSLSEIPDLSKVTKMGTSAFYYCSSLKASIDLSSLTEIPAYAFSYAPITVTKLSDSLTEIGTWAFISGKIKYTSKDEIGYSTLTFPSTLKSIGAYAFYGADLPTTVVIPDSTTSIGKGAFQYTTTVTNFEIGSGLDTISENAFSGYWVKNITINNAEDRIKGTSNLPSSVKVEYLIPSAEAKDDKISNDANALTLQEAVNQATDGEVITITDKNVKLFKTLNIPAGKNITITANDSTYAIFADKNSNLKDLIHVEEGATITFKNIQLLGTYNSESVIDDCGKLTIEEGATIQYSYIKGKSTGVVDVHGSNASLTIAGGSIENNSFGESATSSSPVRVSDGASVDITGGEIKNNKVNEKSNATAAGGILLAGNTSGTMSGGTISGNTSRRGSAVMLYGSSSSRTTFDMSGGSITGNTCTNGSSEMSTAGGAVQVVDNATFTMTGGVISNNISEHVGGGVCVVDWELQNGKTKTYSPTAFIMNGGTIDGNSARNGGGIYSYSDGVVLNKGTISNNVASVWGGGIYSEGNDDTGYSTLHAYNVYISKNTATNQGGGLWYCPTGDGEAFSVKGATIFNNTADGAGDDVVSSNASKSPFNQGKTVLTLQNKTLSGGYVIWYQDGGLQNNPGITKETDPTVPRYSEENAKAFNVTDITNSIALKAIYGSGEVSDKNAELFIVGNTAARGGGIAANGGVIIGEDVDKGNLELSKEMVKDETTTDKFTFEITLTDENGTPVSGAYKAYYNDSNEASTIVFKNGKAIVELGQNEKIKIIDIEKNVTYKVIEKETDGYTVDKISIGDTSYTFTKKDKEGYSIKETMVDGKLYVTKTDDEKNTEDPQVIQKDTTASIKFTNKKCTSLTVKKVWKLDDGGKKTEYVIVDLLKNGVVDQTVTLSDKNNWTYTWNTLDVSSTYTVQERTVDGFTTTIIKQDNTFTITNDDKPKPSTPTLTPSTPTTYKLVKTDAK